MASVDIKDIECLIELFNDSDWDEFDLEMDGVRIFLSNDPSARPSFGSQTAATATSHAAKAAPSAAATQEKETAAVTAVPEGLIAVRARNLGTFYRSPKPGAAPYVELGQTVAKDTEMCLIEVMKLFTALRAGACGVVQEICAQDGDMVEGEQILFLLDPAN